MSDMEMRSLWGDDKKVHNLISPVTFQRLNFFCIDRILSCSRKMTTRCCRAYACMNQTCLRDTICVFCFDLIWIRIDNLTWYISFAILGTENKETKTCAGHGSWNKAKTERQENYPEGFYTLLNFILRHCFFRLYKC